MKHYILTGNPTSDRCIRANESTGNVCEFVTYDARKKWPLRGFTRMCNEILANAGDEIVCIYNDDIVFEDFEGWTARVTEAIVAHDAAIVAPVQADMKNPQSVIMGRTYAAFPGGMHGTGTRKDNCRDAFEPCKWIPFCAVAFNPRALRVVGLLDEQMCMWFSDSDWCLRARLAGFNVILDRGSIILHENHATTGAIEPGSPNAIRFIADQEAFRRKWGGDQLADMS
jgi:GT2 family glycosyltransferase